MSGVTSRDSRYCREYSWSVWHKILNHLLFKFNFWPWYDNFADNWSHFLIKIFIRYTFYINIFVFPVGYQKSIRTNGKKLQSDIYVMSSRQANTSLSISMHFQINGHGAIDDDGDDDDEQETINDNDNE